MGSDQVHHTTIRFTATFHERLRIALARKRMRSIQQAAQVALEQWLSDVEGGTVAAVESPADENAFGRLTGAETRWVGMLLEVLRSGNVQARKAVTANLELFSRHVRLLQERGEKNVSGDTCVVIVDGNSSFSITQQELSLVLDLQSQINFLCKVCREWEAAILARAAQRGARVEPGPIRIGLGCVIQQPMGCRRLEG